MTLDDKKKIEHLVVDTSAFIQNAPIRDIAANFYTIQEVVDEITNKRQLRRLCVLPYELKVKHVFPENISAVTEFSKKTGDYRSLSATDIKVMALCLQLEKEFVGSEHIATSPIHQQTINFSKDSRSFAENLPGFYFPKERSKNVRLDDEKDQSCDEEDIGIVSNKEEGNEKDQSCDEEDIGMVSNKEKGNEKDQSCDEEDIRMVRNKEEGNEKDVIENELNEKFGKIDFETIDKICSKTNEDLNQILIPVEDESNVINEDLTNNELGDNDWVMITKKHHYKKQNFDSQTIPEDENKNNDDYDSEYEDGDWITPQNVKNAVMQAMGLTSVQDSESEPVTVACMTKDFAMQNVLKQMNLNVSVLNGQIIKQLRTYIFRCYSCFKTTSLTTKAFCPKCGYATLKRVSVSVNEEGKQVIHVNLKKPISKRGKKYSLPTPRGGKHADNPLLSEDQPVPDRKPSRLARAKTDALADDYVAGYSPFVTRDVNSRSALLGIRNKPLEVKHWMRKNPNEARRKRK